MAASREELIMAVIEAQQRVMQSFTSLAEPNWVELDLSLTQLKSLMVLTASGSMPIHRLAELLHVQRSATSTLVDHLVRLDLVTRAEDPSDRRRTLVDLTPSGRKLVTRLRDGRDDMLRVALAGLSEDDLLTFVRIINTIADYATALAEANDPRPVEGDAP